VAEEQQQGGGLFGWVRSSIVKFVAPDAKEVQEDNLGSSINDAAYFDKAQNRWVFPGQENNDDNAAMRGPPPTNVTFNPGHSHSVGGGGVGGGAGGGVLVYCTHGCVWDDVNSG